MTVGTYIIIIQKSLTENLCRGHRSKTTLLNTYLLRTYLLTERSEMILKKKHSEKAHSTQNIGYRNYCEEGETIS